MHYKKIYKKAKKERKASHSCRIACERSESAWERIIVLHKSNHHHHHHHQQSLTAVLRKHHREGEKRQKKLYLQLFLGCTEETSPWRRKEKKEAVLTAVPWLYWGNITVEEKREKRSCTYSCSLAVLRKHHRGGEKREKKLYLQPFLGCTEETSPWRRKETEEAVLTAVPWLYWGNITVKEKRDRRSCTYSRSLAVLRKHHCGGEKREKKLYLQPFLDLGTEDTQQSQSHVPHNAPPAVVSGNFQLSAPDQRSTKVPATCRPCMTEPVALPVRWMWARGLCSWRFPANEAETHQSYMYCIQNSSLHDRSNCSEHCVTAEIAMQS